MWFHVVNSKPILQKSMCVLFIIGTKTALEKNAEKTIEDFHKLLISLNNSESSSNEDVSEEEDDVVRIRVMKKINPTKMIVVLKRTQYQVLLGINMINQLKLQFLAG
jgi:hypothetical protein